MDISEMFYLAMHPEEQKVIHKPKGANKMYAIGEWIRVADYSYSCVDFVGYILDYNRELKTYKIHLTKNKHHYPVNLEVILHEDGIYQANLEDGFDTSFLIDLALDTKDEKWFTSLWEENIKGENENVER